MTKILSILAGIFVFTFQSCGNYETAEFWVRGNCEHCEERIEGILSNLEGVQSADWNVETKIVTVYHDPGKQNLKSWHASVAAAGHETRDLTANQTAYDELPKCCKKAADQ